MFFLNLGEHEHERHSSHLKAEQAPFMRSTKAIKLTKHELKGMRKYAFPRTEATLRPTKHALKARAAIKAEKACYMLAQHAMAISDIDAACMHTCKNPLYSTNETLFYKRHCGVVKRRYGAQRALLEPPGNDPEWKDILLIRSLKLPDGDGWNAISRKNEEERERESMGNPHEAQQSRPLCGAL